MVKDFKDVTSLEELEQLLRSINDDDNSESTEEEPNESDQDNLEDQSTEDSEGDSQPTDEEKFRAWFLSQDPEELIKTHPGVQGKLGEMVDKRTRAQIARDKEQERLRIQKMIEDQEEEQLLQLAETDPEAAARELAERISKKRDHKKTVEITEQRQQEYGAMLASEMEEIYQTPIMNEFSKNMTDDQIFKLYWKNGQYGNFSEWAEGMLTTVRDYYIEEGRKQALAQSANNTSNPSPEQKESSAKKAVNQRQSYSANLDVEVNETGEFKPGDVEKMDWKTYFANRNNVRKSIFGDD